MLDLGTDGEFLGGEKKVLLSVFVLDVVAGKNLYDLLNCTQFWLLLTRFGKKNHSSVDILILQL